MQASTAIVAAWAENQSDRFRSHGLRTRSAVGFFLSDRIEAADALADLRRVDLGRSDDPDLAPMAAPVAQDARETFPPPRVRPTSVEVGRTVAAPHGPTLAA